MNKLIKEVIQVFQSYYDDFVIFLPKLIIATIVFSIFYFFASRVRNVVKSRLEKQMDDPLLARFLSRIIRVVIITIALLIVLQILGLGGTAGGVLATAGLGAFVIGFAFKDIGENFLAGIILAFDRPFRVGDVVDLDGVTGTVVALNFRTTHLKSFDGKDMYIPNANIIKTKVVNYTIDGYLRYSFEIGLDYGADVMKAQKLVLETLYNVEGIIKEGPKSPSVNLSSLGVNTLNLTAYYWIDTFDKSVSSSKLKTSILHRAIQSLEKENFYLPGNILEIRNYKDSVLAAGGKEI